MNGAKTVFFMAIMTVFTVLVGGIFDAYFGGGGVIVMIFFAVALAMNFFSYWFADTIVLKMHKARVVGPEEAPALHAIVDRLVERSGLPKPKVCVLPSQTPNAFATGRNRNHAAVAVTEGLMRNLSRDELEGVVAHELAHIKHYDMLLGTMMASMAGLVALLSRNAMWGMMFGMGRRRGNNSNPLAAVGMILVLVAAPMFAMMLRGLVSQQREFAADEGGAKMSGNPAALASALKKIDAMARGMAQRQVAPDMGTQATAHLYFINHFSLGRASRLFSTHPPTEERIERLLALEGKMYV